MALYVKNLTNSTILIDDLGIELSPNIQYDLTDMSNAEIAISDDLRNHINNNNLAFIHPTNNTILSKSDSLKLLDGVNDPPFGVRGGTLDQLDDVDVSTVQNNDVLTYDSVNSTWIPRPPQGGTVGHTETVKEQFNQPNHGFSQGTVVYYNGSIWKAAIANSEDTLGIGLIDVIDNDNFYVVYEGDISGLSNLTPSKWYYLSDTNQGILTDTEPQIYSNPMGFAKTTSTFNVVPLRAVEKISYQDTNYAIKVVSQINHGFSVGTPIYYDGVSWKAAIANSENTLATDVVSKVINQDLFECITLGRISGLSGLVAGTWYYVSDTNAGTLTTNEPQIYSNPIGIAENSTTLFVLPLRAVKYP